MKLIALYFCDELLTVFNGRHYKFKRNIPVEVDDPLADKLLATGEFMQILGDASVIPGEILPEPITPPAKKKRCKGCH